MQHAKQESAQESTDDSDNQIIDDSLAFPFYDQACEPTGHQTNQQEPNNIHQHNILLASFRWFTSLCLLVSRSNRRGLQMFGNGTRIIALLSSRPRNRQRDANVLGEIRPKRDIIPV